MPMYEFVCSACGRRFEELVAVGTTTATCPGCGARGAERVLSPAATPFQLVKSRGEARKQERSNASMRKRAKEGFKARRRRAREQARRGGGDGGG